MGKSEMRSALVFLVVVVGMILAATLWSGMPAIAATATLNLDSGNGTIEVDDSGGYEAYNEVIWDGLSHVGTIALAVYDSISEDLDNVGSYDYKGDSGDDRVDLWANDQSGIQAYASPVSGMPACVGDVAADDGGSPSVPVSFRGANTGLTIQQFVYAGKNDAFVIHQYKIINGTGTTKNIKVAHLNDFDVASTYPNEEQGYDAANKLVWIWESYDGGYIAGTALLQRSVSNYFLEDCCTLTWGDYADQKGFFTGDPAFNGNKYTGPGDLEVDIATDVGVLLPGESATVAFAFAVAKGATSATALAGLQAKIAAASACYDEIPPPSSPAPVPTMGHWGALWLCVLMAAPALWFMRRRRRAQITPR